VKDAALRDNPAADPADVNPVRDYGDQRHLHDQDQPGVHDLLRAWRRLLGTYEGDRVMVGEVFLFDPARVATYYGTASDELPLAFNFSFPFSPWDAAAFRAQVDRFEAVLPAGTQPTLVLSNHDVPRHRTRYDDPAWGDARARLAATMLLTLRGTPFLYYGEEIGMRHVHVPADRIQDPVGHRLPAFGRDPSRTPMQWSDAPNAGFSAAARTWLPVGDTAVSVRAQTDDPRSLLAHYRRLLGERRRSAALRRGTYRPLDGPPDTFVYVREHQDEHALVALNFRGEARTLALPGVAGGRVRLSTHPERPLDRFGDRLSLQPVEGVIIDLP
jgi:alpha-glucosidase